MIIYSQLLIEYMLKCYFKTRILPLYIKQRHKNILYSPYYMEDRLRYNLHFLYGLCLIDIVNGVNDFSN